MALGASATLDIVVDPLVAGWEPVNVLWEVAVKEGYGLTSSVSRLKVGDNTVWHIADDERGQHFHLCLDERVSLDLVRELKLGADDLFVCRDSALTDTDAANLALQCRLRTI